jgi:hypothetical protein
MGTVFVVGPTPLLETELSVQQREKPVLISGTHHAAGKLADIKNIRKLSIFMGDGKVIDRARLPERPV